MKIADFKDLSPVELLAKGRDMRQEMFNLRLQQATGQLQKPSRIRELRRDVARVETRLSQIRNEKKAAVAVKS